MSTCVYTGLNPFNFIRKHSADLLVRCFLWTQLLQFLNNYVCVGDHDTLQILLLPTDKSLGVRYGERGGHKFLQMTRYPKISFRTFILLLAVFTNWNNRGE
jgi:hypothetical protein